LINAKINYLKKIDFLKYQGQQLKLKKKMNQRKQKTGYALNPHNGVTNGC